MYKTDMAFMLSFAVCLALGVMCLSRFECRIKADAKGYDHDFGVIQGCRVKYHGAWIDYSNLPNMEK